jgi:hypothetical protein
VNSDDFGEDIGSKPYPKYEYQSVLSGKKRVENEAFLRALNGSIDHLYNLHSLGKKGYYISCPKKSASKALKAPDSATFPFEPTFQLDHGNLVEIGDQKELKREQFRGKQTR